MNETMRVWRPKDNTCPYKCVSYNTAKNYSDYSNLQPKTTSTYSPASKQAPSSACAVLNPKEEAGKYIRSRQLICPTYDAYECASIANNEQRCHSLHTRHGATHRVSNLEYACLLVRAQTRPGRNSTQSTRIPHIMDVHKAT